MTFQITGVFGAWHICQCRI